jgi:hypothetical protein
MARPPKAIDWDLVQLKMEAGCKASQIYPLFNINDETFYRRFKEEYGVSFQDFKDEAFGIGDGKLLQTQYEKAVEGNIQMLTWLGKVRLKQKEFEDESQLQSPNKELNDLRYRNMFLEEEARKRQDADKS